MGHAYISLRLNCQQQHPSSNLKCANKIKYIRKHILNDVENACRDPEGHPPYKEEPSGALGSSLF